MTTVAIGQHHREDGRLQIIKILISQGTRIESKNTKGWTALITASFCGAVDVLLLLLANGADVDAKAEDGLTATIVAAQVGLLCLESALWYCYSMASRDLIFAKYTRYNSEWICGCRQRPA